ncbi:hypothetical protein M5689_023094 [Euphorbia peplus]|nr:hypothetical protein M5689_023094 [Euphorbia peplus]
MCQNCHQDSHDSCSPSKAGEVKHEDYSSISSCAAVPQLSPVSIMSERFVYLRKDQQGKLAPPITKRSGEDSLSVISSDTPSVAVRELHATSQSEHANENPPMPSITVNGEPAVFKSESINRHSAIKEQDTDRISKYNDKKFVYRRKNPKGRYTGVLSQEVPYLSDVSSDSPSDAIKELHVASQSDPFVSSSVCKRGNHVVGEEESNKASKCMRRKMIEVGSLNSSCSSSKSDAELVSASMQTEADDSVDCSSSSVKAAECLEEGMSEKDLCISLLRSQGVIDGTSPSKNCASAECVRDVSKSSSSRLCKICSHLESTLRMLICDSCEEAFHLSCCDPRVRKIPIDDEWFCHSCSKKRHKILSGAISTSSYMIGEEGRCVSSSIEKSNLILLTVRDTEPYSSRVPCGKGFQAEVPEWSGPITNNIDEIPEPSEMDPSDFISSIELDFNKRSKGGSTTNWLQCRAVVGDAGESDVICGKWRRAPLCKLQTDNWECFCCVGWDPVHADCATPQELETNQVLKQLQLIERVRPRLEAKRSEHMKKDNDSTEALKQQQQEPEQQNPDQQKPELQNPDQQKLEEQNPNQTIMYRRRTHRHNIQN